ncbi:MAG TPA: rhodanese-like domain-containing protein, partial [bacterium]|nr:rhodanese-like domain-containing protein [bacterium]
MKRRSLVVFLCVLAIALSGTARAGAVKDGESASHDDSAATYQVVDTYAFPGLTVKQFNLGVLSHYSYMLESGGEALVVDPGRDIDTYLETAKKDGVRIVGVFLTHSHADFVAGHTEFAKQVGCPVYINKAAGAEYAHEPLTEASDLKVGTAVVRFLATPGHTPDGMCGMVFSAADKKDPECVFTGDTLFIGSIGRPDLMGGTISAAALASMSYDTWHNKLSKLADPVKIFPAHGAGSLCGAHLSDRPVSTIGEEKAANPYMKHRSRGEFVAAVLDGLPEAPQYFKHNAAMNKKGPAPVDWIAPLPKEEEPGSKLSDPAAAYLSDIREPAAYAEAHIPNAVNIGLRGRLETWTGIMVPWGSPLVVCGSVPEVTEALKRLRRIGYDDVRYITFDAWKNAGMPVKKNDMITPRVLYDRMQKGDAPIIVDVRLPNEWMASRIGTVVNLPLNHLDELSSKLDPAQPAVAVCNSAYRSSMAVGVLERRGFSKAMSLAGGAEAWTAAGLPVIGAKPAAAAAAPVPLRSLGLPEQIDAAALARSLSDLPGTLEIVDIRPAAHFADYAIPGSRNADIAEVMKDPSYLAGSVPLVIVDRDGSVAMAVGGVLSQKTKREIKVLYGGVEAFWKASGARAPSGAGSVPAVSPAPAAAPQMQA